MQFSRAGSDDNVDQPAGNDHQLARHAAGEMLARAFAGQGSGFDSRPIGTCRQPQATPQLAVDLQHQFDFIVLQGARIGLRKGLAKWPFRPA
jgi:hypothetical protein